MDKVKEFFGGSSKPAEEAQTEDKPSIQHQRVDSSVTPADLTSPDETAQAPEDKTADQPSGEAGQDLKDTGLTETQPELLEASKDQSSHDEARDKAAENAPSLDNLGEGEQKDNAAVGQEQGDLSKVGGGDQVPQDVQAEPTTSDAPAVEPSQEQVDPTSLREDAPAVQDTPAVAEDTPAAAEDTPAATEDTPAATEDTPAVAEESKPTTVEPDQEHGDPSKLREDDPAAQDSGVGPDVPATQTGEEPGQLGAVSDTVQGGDAVSSSKPDEPTAQTQPEATPQESLGEEKPQAVASDEQPPTSVTEGGLTEARQEESTSDAAAGTGLEEAKDAGLHETQPEILEASQDGHPSIDDAQTKAEENAPDVAQPSDPAPAAEESVGRDEGVADAPVNVEQPSEAKDDSGPSAQGLEGGALASSGGLGTDAPQDNDQLPAQSQQETDVTAQDTSDDVPSSTIKPEDDAAPQTEQPLSTGGAEVQDAGTSQPEPGLSEVPQSSEPAGDVTGEKIQETGPDVTAESQQPVTSELQDRPTADEPKEDQGQSQPGLSQPGLSEANVGESQLDTPAGDSKAENVPGTQKESLVDAGGPPQDREAEVSAPTDQPKETPPEAQGAKADPAEEHGDEEGEDTGDPDKKPKLTERLKEKVKHIVKKDE